jgi:chromatin structure-remodeling complex subunit RSC9
LYSSLLAQLDHNDRGFLLPTMRAIIRFSMETPMLHRLTDVPVKTLERVVSFLLLETDDDLTSSSLDFLYQYTALPENLDFVLKVSPALLPSLTSRLANLLLHSARPFEERIMVRAAQKHAPNSPIPNIPDDLHAQLLEFLEPERSSRWLKCCFEESPTDDITQIAIWQAYQARFAGNSPIPAADFIKNVSNTFSTAQAQVINGPNACGRARQKCQICCLDHFQGKYVENGTHRGTTSGLTCLRTISTFPNPKTGSHFQIKLAVPMFVVGLDACDLPSL